MTITITPPHPHKHQPYCPKFLDFFFSRVKRNDTGPHPEYPFVSPVRCAFWDC